MAINDIFLSVLLVLSSILVIVLIILCIKLVYTAKKMDIILNDVEKKLSSVNGVFRVIDIFTDGVSDFCDTLFAKTGSFLRKIFKKKKDTEEDIE